MPPIKCNTFEGQLNIMNDPSEEITIKWKKKRVKRKTRFWGEQTRTQACIKDFNLFLKSSACNILVPFV